MLQSTLRILMIAIGIFLALFPTLSLEITRWIFIIALVSAGLSMITADLTGKNVAALFPVPCSVPLIYFSVS